MINRDPAVPGYGNLSIFSPTHKPSQNTRGVLCGGPASAVTAAISNVKDALTSYTFAQTLMMCPDILPNGEILQLRDWACTTCTHFVNIILKTDSIIEIQFQSVPGLEKAIPFVRAVICGGPG
ncbi:hypothetical protein CAEBREN_15610 [Caenorhabditis brenneri]|uniref:Uncharacterized protein n=1 Tax=Caenorhabditis brenneri TaxID=135651 RepID=G0NE46_CAEBE|nr:hypothetical protein CAEBREN_15610 [Caenorhabditis brenneri]